MNDTTNPLLDFSDLPRYDLVQPAQVTDAVDRLLAEGRALVERLTSPDAPASWDEFVAPMAESGERLGRAWGVVSHLHSVLDSPELREAYNENQPKIVEFYTELGQNLALFEKYKAIAASAGFADLPPARRLIIEHEVRDFRLSGAELSDADKPRFGEIQAEMAQLSTKFSENVLDATRAFSLTLNDASALAGVPADELAALAEAAARDGRSGYKITLQMPSYLPVMQYGENRELRALLYRAHGTRASEQYAQSLAEAAEYERRANGESTARDVPDCSGWDNGKLIEDIVRLRTEEARLLGYGSFAELSLVPKMADTPDQVLAFLRDLGRRARPFAERDVAELRAFARDTLGLATLEPWDVAWASEKLRAARYAFSEQEVKQYFPEPRVFEGMFRVVQSIYGVRIEADTAPIWHPDVRFFRISRPDGSLIGQFYLDAYARDSKRGGAWMDEARAHQRKGATVQTPVAYMVCNFAAPVGGKPALLTHDDVITLFHEFGHALHHLMSQVEDLQVSGIHGVEWDAVELPSQFMENFCWEWDVLQHMTSHVDTGETLPRALYERMLAARNFQSGMQMMRQLEFSLFDLRLHFDGAQMGVQRLLEEVRSEVAVLTPPAWHRFPQGFSHIFAGGYAAGYYSYKWAEVLSADAYALFEENGVLDAATGARFRDEILAVGGSRPAIESFKAFRGRAPTVDALLRHSGMIDALAA
jgi:oligopeptidase A